MKQFKHQEYKEIGDILSIYSNPVTGVARCCNIITCETRYTNIPEKCNGYKVVTQEGHYCPCRIRIDSKINKKEVEWSDCIEWREQ